MDTNFWQSGIWDREVWTDQKNFSTLPAFGAGVRVIPSEFYQIFGIGKLVPKLSHSIVCVMPFWQNTDL